MPLECNYECDHECEICTHPCPNYSVEQAPSASFSGRRGLIPQPQSPFFDKCKCPKCNHNHFTVTFTNAQGCKTTCCKCGYTWVRTLKANCTDDYSDGYVVTETYDKLV